MRRTMDDYYELLGVDEDAPVDDIRAAYRDKKASVDTSASDDAKSEVAALNRAWNVLSDPYQRGRYDQQRIAASETDEDDYDDDDVEAAPVARTRTPRAADRAEKRRQAREPAPPTIKLPAGMQFATTRARLTAMAIDIFVLLALFIGSQFLLVSLEKANHPGPYHQVTNVLPDKISKAHDATSKANKAASAADKKLTELKNQPGTNSSDIEAAQAAATKAKHDVTVAKDAEKKLDDEFTKQSDVLAPTSRLVNGLFFLAALLVLLVPSILLGGQTLGKRLQRVRVARMDGSRARFTDLFRRYALLVFAAYALSFVAGPAGALIVAFVAGMWSRNPNRQGLHDRFAKTIVVADDEA